MKPYFILSIFLAAISSILVFTSPASRSLTEEGNIVETLSLILWFALVITILFCRPVKWITGNWLCTFLALMCAFREMDLDKAFTSQGIFKSNFYKSPDISLFEKIPAAIVIITLLVVLMLLLKRYGMWLFRNLPKKNPIALGVFFAVIFAFTSKLILDGLSRKLRNIGLINPAWLKTHGSVLEEVVELGIPVALLIASYTAIKARKESI